MAEAFGKLWFVQESEIGQSLLLFFVRPAKKQRAIKIKCSQTHFTSVLGHHTSFQKKTLLSWGNLVLQEREPRKASFPSLGSWLVVWATNEMCTFIAEYETLKYRKENYLKSKLQIFFKMPAKNRIISARSLKIWLYMQNGTEI